MFLDFYIIAFFYISLHEYLKSKLKVMFIRALPDKVFRGPILITLSVHMSICLDFMSGPYLFAFLEIFSLNLACLLILHTYLHTYSP